MPFFVYVLQNDVTGRLYKGQTQDLEKRLKEHSWSQTKTTSINSKCWKLIYYETCDSRTAALKREKYFKSAAGRRFLKKEIQNNA